MHFFLFLNVCFPCSLAELVANDGYGEGDDEDAEDGADGAHQAAQAGDRHHLPVTHRGHRD